MTAAPAAPAAAHKSHAPAAWPAGRVIELRSVGTQLVTDDASHRQRAVAEVKQW